MSVYSDPQMAAYEFVQHKSPPSPQCSHFSQVTSDKKVNGITMATAAYIYAAQKLAPSYNLPTYSFTLRLVEVRKVYFFPLDIACKKILLQGLVRGLYRL